MFAILLEPKNRPLTLFDTIRKIAGFFKVSVDYVLGQTNIRETPESVIDNSLRDDPLLMEICLEIKSRKDLQFLFREVKPMTPEDVKKVIPSLFSRQQCYEYKKVIAGFLFCYGNRLIPVS